MIFTLPLAADRRWVRDLTARLRDLPGVEMVHVGNGQLQITGRMDQDRVRAVLVSQDEA